MEGDERMDKENSECVVFYWKGNQRIPLCMTDIELIFNPHKYETVGDPFKGYEKERLYALYQGKAFLIHEPD